MDKLLNSGLNFNYNRDNQKDFNISLLIKEHNSSISNDIEQDNMKRFYDLCDEVFDHISKKRMLNNKNPQLLDKEIKRQKRAIIGYQSEVLYYLTQIDDFLQENNKTNRWHPAWYKNLRDALFQECYGFAGLSEWLYGYNTDLATSSSAKIIGENIYFLINGKQVLQKQKMSSERRMRLRKALLLNSKKRDGEGYFEVYTLDGVRISIYGDEFTKDGKDIFVFRKFLVKDYSFERQAELGTIPKDSVALLSTMAKVGYNVAFIGAVRTAKTTFLTTWQTYEDKNLEGVMIETDPEIPIHKIMPGAPIAQIVADGEKLENIMKGLLRTDTDYIIMAEARDATAFHIALEATDRGTRRSKLTAHFSRGQDFAYSMAKKISSKYGGNIAENTLKIYQNIHYVFELVQLADKSQKRLKAIYEHRYDSVTHEVYTQQICKYNYETDNWTWKYSIGDDKRIVGMEENPKDFKKFKRLLSELAEKYPLKEEGKFIPINKE